MSSIVSRGLLGCGLAIALLSPALAAGESCATGTGPVPEGTQVVGPCMNDPTPTCPARGPVYECKDGKWFCVHGRNVQNPPPCTNLGGAWVWSNDKGLHRP
jgi:hypothetical protein